MRLKLIVTEEITRSSKLVDHRMKFGIIGVLDQILSEVSVLVGQIYLDEKEMTVSKVGLKYLEIVNEILEGEDLKLLEMLPYCEFEIEVPDSTKIDFSKITNIEPAPEIDTEAERIKREKWNKLYNEIGWKLNEIDMMKEEVCRNNGYDDEEFDDSRIPQRPKWIDELGDPYDPSF